MNDRSRVPYEQPDEQIAALRTRVKELTRELDRLAHGETGVMRATGLEYEVRSLRDRLKMTSTAREILAEHRTTIAEFEKRQAEAKLAEVQAELQKKRDDWVMVVGLATKLEARLAAVVDALGNPRADPRYESTGRMLRAIRISEEGLAAAREQPTQAFECKARTGKADPPQDCDWPFCGCDPAAERVLTAIQESGLKLVREPTQDKGEKADG
jgi:hypothetical protein